VRALSENESLLRRIDTLVSRMDVLEEAPPRERDDATRAQGRVLALELAAARSAYEAALVRVAERDGAGTAMLGSRRVSAPEVQAVLGSGEAVLEYFVTPHRVIGFVLTTGAMRTFATDGPLEDLARRVRLARDLLGAPDVDPGELAAVLRGLHAILVAPAERAGMLRDARRLIIVPHSVLAYLPFAALEQEGTGRYLVEDHALQLLPSAAALVVLRRTGGPMRGSAPGVPAKAFAPFPATLPGSAREVRLVGRTIPGSVIRSGRKATEADLRRALSDGGIVHVATHGVMNVRNPMFSRIELARGAEGPEDDGRLEVHELLDLRIRSPLVFLSGCETGVGAAWSTRFARGEDYATLAQAFLYAGAGGVMATLWRIRDAGGAAFAETFYARLVSQPPADALAAAQRDLLHSSSYAAPYYWAGYQLSGDDRTYFRPHR
jgi:CHAT domain-containing protein